ncbi:MAG: zinc-dependent peptidase [Saprospiraceae bacterium]|nr:zinc-dependent peptidase [Saprospiraceae bacterium]MBP7699872.1 zinc-dependent peptidase [Saprospiraceae bacterium]
MLPSNIKFSYLLAFPITLCLFAAIYITYSGGSQYALWIAPFVVALVVIYLLSPQIDWWWYQRNPPDIHEPMRIFLQQHHKFYQQLSVAQKQKFRERMALYIEANEFIQKGFGDEESTVPHGIRGIIAANAVYLTFGKDDFLMNKFEHIIVYPQQFPSPQFPRQFHSSEIFVEDGVIMFSAEHLMSSFTHPQQYYNIGLHEYAQVFMLSAPHYPYPQMDEHIWQHLEAISGMSKDYIHRYINLPDIPPLPVSIHHFFQFPVQMQQILPELYQTYTNIFKITPQQSY